VEGERLPREDLLDILGLLMIAGLDTVAASLACFLSHLARHPDERRRLVADPSLWPSAIEELLRFESPVTDGGRIALADLELPSGEHIAAGSRMGISWHAANLDPDVFGDPLEVDFDRAPNPHIGFASGFHRCLGSHLARMEMHVALDVWHQRIPDYEIAPGSDLTYSGNPRAPHHLTLTW
jgi:cytochrome P450